MSHLEGNDQAVARKVISERKPLLRTAFVDLLEARQSVIATMKTDTHNPQILANAMTRSEEAVDRLNENFRGLLRDITLGISAEVRKKIGERLSRHQRDWNTER